jgi:hypothetical protein
MRLMLGFQDQMPLTHAGRTKNATSLCTTASLRGLGCDRKNDLSIAHREAYVRDFCTTNKAWKKRTQEIFFATYGNSSATKTMQKSNWRCDAQHKRC